MTRYAVDIRLGRKPPACPNTSEPWVENALACGSEVLGGGGGGVNHRCKTPFEQRKQLFRTVPHGEACTAYKMPYI